MKLSEVADEFSNQPVTLKHLFRVQTARVHEYVLYYNFLENKYADVPKGFVHRHFSVADFIKDKIKGLMSPEDFQEMIRRQKTYLSSDEQLKLESKFTRMFKAKQNFEMAGGKYYNFTKLKRPKF